ncbi:interleukin-8-like isoform X1 [Stegostoma tigrinum]|uniref:interleukin-8-like isoform X1 n=1 Tax=Stegostoma tigrinum TaxID=3053191 RepID=UPI00202B73FA|nr:interleukin-8-like isoform X1 [Stegostoma tigrinum]
MKRAVTLTILALLLCAVTAQALSYNKVLSSCSKRRPNWIPIPGIQGRCKCIRTTASHFDPKLIRSIKYIPRGSHCMAIEIIVTMKNGKKLCMNPKAQWMKSFIKAIKASRLQN